MNQRAISSAISISRVATLTAPVCFCPFLPAASKVLVSAESPCEYLDSGVAAGQAGFGDLQVERWLA